MTKYLTTTGTIISAAVGIGQSITTTASGHSSRLQEMYYPDITYQYTVDDQVYQNSRFWNDDVQINQHDKIAAIVQQYPVGAEVPVHYNPEHPLDSYLQTMTREKGDSSPIIILTFIVGIAFVIGMIILILVVSQAQT